MNRLDAINLALIRAIEKHYSILRCQIQLLRPASPGTPLLEGFGVCFMQAKIGPVLSQALTDSAVAVEAKVALRGQRTQLPVLHPCLASIFDILTDFSDSISQAGAVAILCIDSVLTHL